MEVTAKKVSLYLFRRGFVQEDQLDWCCYLLEKNILRCFSFLVLFLVGARLFSPIQTVLFLFSLSFLRSRTNGYHAKSFCHCLMSSITCEVVCLAGCRLFNEVSSLFFLAAASIVILKLSPVNNSNIHFDDFEMKRLKVQVKQRLLILSVISLFLVLTIPSYAFCVVSAICLTALLLSVSHLGFGIQ